MSTSLAPIDFSQDPPVPRPVSASLPIGGLIPERGFWRKLALVRPGKNSVRLGGACLLLSAVYFLFPSLVVLVVLGLIILAGMVGAIVGYRRLLQSLARIEVRRAIPIVVGRGTPFVVGWEIENHGPAEIHGWLRDVVPADGTPRFSSHALRLPAAVGRLSFNETFQISVRGMHEFGPVWIRLRDPWELIEVQRSYHLPARIKILPELFASPEKLLKDQGAQMQLLDQSTKTRQHGVGTEFESLTEFREGDDPRRIDWRTSARIQRPVVRRFQIERHRDVMILVDSGRLMGTEADRGTKLDCAIDAGLILARVALQSGDRCGMAVYDNEVRGYLPPVTGLPSLPALSESLYAIQSNFRETNFEPIFTMLQTRQAKRSLIVVISDLSDAETSTTFRASLGRLGQRHVVLFAALRSPILNRMLRAPVNSMVDGAKKAVIFRLLHERQLALQSLKHVGVHVIDVEPHQLTVPLVNQFIQLRQRNLV